MRADFLKNKHKSISLLGMSGVGKTFLATLLRKQGDWYHYSGDYRIGTRYLSEAILDNIKKQLIGNALFRELLVSDSIFVRSNITFDNLLPISSFLGKVGNPELGGLPINVFKQRQKLHYQAEKNAMLDVVDFIKKSREIYGYSHFINDAGGSLCDLIDEPSILSQLAEHTLIVYIKASEKTKKSIISRALATPKPLYYQSDFLNQQLNDYLKFKKFDFVAQIDPDDFSRWVFPKLFDHRLPKYEKIAQQYGVTIDSDRIARCKTADDFLNCLAEKLN